MGMYIVHRLVNEQDRAIVEKACGYLDQSAAKFLPTLTAGEALLVGVDLPMPTAIQIKEPTAKPNSTGPDYLNWKKKSENTEGSKV
jgi:DNA helicase HerA-like ATPase